MSGREATRDLAELARRIREFAHARDWEQYHTPKNLAMALSVEVAELLEPFQWLTAKESESLARDPEQLAAVADELADVAIYLLRLADVMGVDLGTAIHEKLEVNERRFPPRSGEAPGESPSPWPDGLRLHLATSSGVLTVGPAAGGAKLEKVRFAPAESLLDAASLRGTGLVVVEGDAPQLGRRTAPPENKLSVLRSDGSTESRQDLPVAALQALDDAFVAASRGDLVSFDPELQVLDRIPLINGKKDAHDLLVVGSRVHALDNIVMPVWIAIVDAAEPGALRVVAREEIHLLNAHLQAQFVDGKQGLWLVVTSFAHMGGGGQELLVHSAVNGSSLGRRMLLFRPSIGFPEEDPPRGYGFADEIVLWRPGLIEPPALGLAVQTSSAEMPAWVVIHSGVSPSDKAAYLARLECRGEEVLLTSFIALPARVSHVNWSVCEVAGAVVAVSDCGSGGPDESGGLDITCYDARSGGQVFHQVLRAPEILGARLIRVIADRD